MILPKAKKNQNKASLLASIVESTKDGIISVSLEGIIQSWNHGAKEIFGYEPDEIIGCHISKIVPPDKLDESENVLRAVKKGCSCKRYETVRINKEGKRINVAMTVSPLKNQGGLIVGFSGIVRDITKYKILQNELNRLDRLNLIGQMSASIAHEIRNPMTTIRGFLQIMREKAELFEYKKYFDLMTGELDRVNGIITEYLSLARNKPRELKKGNIKKIIETMSPLISADARNSNKDVFFKLQEVPDFPLDEKEIRQLLLNLVRNGFEAMEAGKALSISRTSYKKLKFVTFFRVCFAKKYLQKFKKLLDYILSGEM
jgi:two-component system, sporulation sensor kinase E